MENFQELKSIILDRAKEKNACLDNYKRAYCSENMEQLCDVVKDNFWWVCEEGVLDGELIEQYKAAFAANKIYANMSVSEGFMLASDNATVEAWDNATVKAWDNATVKAWDNATVKAWDNATVEASDNATVKAWSNATVEASDNATVKAWGNATVEASDNATVEASDNATVKASDNATVKASDNAYINCRTSISCTISDNVIIRRWDTNTIQYVSNDLKFEKIGSAESE